MIVLVPAVVSLLFALFHPYKKSCFNYIDSLGFALLALTTFLIMYAIQTRHSPILTVLYVMGSIPFLYFISLLLYKTLSQVALIRTCCKKIGETLRARNTDEELRDRIVNPHMYQPLLAVANFQVMKREIPKVTVNHSLLQIVCHHMVHCRALQTHCFSLELYALYSCLYSWYAVSLQCICLFTCKMCSLFYLQ